jgi:rod shape determining protein RodA
MFNFKQYDFKRYNIPLIIVVLLLGMIGAFLIKQVQTEEENLFVKHLIGLAGGILIVVIVSLVDYHFISSFYIILYIINIALLLMVKFMGYNLNDSQRWIRLGPIPLQPSELSKIIMIIFLAKLYSIFRAKINNIFLIGASLILVAIPVYFILDQPNLSTSIVVLFIFGMMIFTAGLSWKIVMPILLIGLPAIGGLFWYIQQDYQVLLKPYQQERVLSILNPELYPEIMFQQDNSVQAIGSGQLYGKLLNDGAEKFRNYDMVPISESDFIFSVAGEEFGFIGSCIIIILFSILIYICLVTAKRAPDYLGMLIAVGIASMFAFQVFVNIGVATSILPNTGIPLPFLSSGLSSMMSSMIAIGIIINIRLQPKKIRG